MYSDRYTPTDQLDQNRKNTLLIFVDMWCNRYSNIANLVDVLYVALSLVLCSLPVNWLIIVKLLCNYSIFALDSREVETSLK